MKPEIKTSRNIWDELINPNFVLNATQHKLWVSCEDEIEVFKRIKSLIKYFENTQDGFALEDAVERIDQHIKHLEGKKE
jgi:hypothetical protein